MDRSNLSLTNESTMELTRDFKKDNLKQKPDQEFLFNHFSKAQDILAKTFIIINCSVSPIPLKQLMNHIEKSIIHSALHVSRGSQKKAAAILGVKQTSLCEKMKKLNIKKDKVPETFFIPGKKF
jgi:DNA-binding NtrC family response regulator